MRRATSRRAASTEVSVNRQRGKPFNSHTVSISYPSKPIAVDGASTEGKGDSWQREPSRRIHQHKNPIVPTPAGRRRERLDAPAVLLLERIGHAIARVVPILALPFGLDDALIQCEALSARRIDDGE